MTSDVSSLIDRLWQYTERHGDCWVWIGDSNKQGYGKIWFRRKTRRVIRVIAWLCLGLRLDYDDRIVRHHGCRNESCWNPSHLRVGTHKENILDQIDDGTHSLLNPNKFHLPARS